jgi:hypothetical protein
MQTISRKEFTSARWVYFSLLLAPVLAVPCSNLIEVTYSLNIDDFGPRSVQIILSSVIPFIFYLPVFLKTRSVEGLFVNTHARQGLMLIFLRFLSWIALLATGNFLFLLFNAFLWLVGSLVGLSQVNKGRSWLGNLQVAIELAPIKMMPTPVWSQRQALVNGALKEAETGHTPMHRHEIVQILMEDFRGGDSDKRQRALEGLETLGEVESF